MSAGTKAANADVVHSPISMAVFVVLRGQSRLAGGVGFRKAHR